MSHADLMEADMEYDDKEIIRWILIEYGVGNESNLTGQDGVDKCWTCLNGGMARLD